jgi:Tol biopolymer transport system component
LTVDGKRAGEGYWSPDGKKLVFQSERDPANPFYQIFVLDFTTGETKRISPGVGKTTCAFFRPGSSEIMFGSTHLDPKSQQYQKEELDFRASGKQRRYAWDYDAAMDIFAYDEKTGAMKQLTTAKGYDAEGGYSPDGQWIVFSSMRDAYNRTLSAAEQKQLELDASYFAEVYIMKADGSGQKRLTDWAGYDGGTFFTKDGRIVWRHFEENGLVANVWTMKMDGTDKRQITDFGAMSWAPYEHPSGEYFLFASNKLGFENFEVFMVDKDGAKEPVRITYTDRGGGVGSAGQIYLAQWNHEAAMAALKAAPPRKANTK